MTTIDDFFAAAHESEGMTYFLSDEQIWQDTGRMDGDRFEKLHVIPPKYRSESSSSSSSSAKDADRKWTFVCRRKPTKRERMQQHPRARNRTTVVRNYGTIGGINLHIRNAATGDVYPFASGSAQEAKLFKVISTVGRKSDPTDGPCYLFYDSRGEYERHYESALYYA